MSGALDFLKTLSSHPNLQSKYQLAAITAGSISDSLTIHALKKQQVRIRSALTSGLINAVPIVRPIHLKTNKSIRV